MGIVRTAAGKSSDLIGASIRFDALALQADAARRGRRARPRRRRAVLSAWGLESWRFSPGSIITFRALVGLALLSPDRLVPGAASVLARVGRTSRALSRRARAFAAGRAHQRDRSRAASPTPHSPHSKFWCSGSCKSAVAKCEAIDWGKNVERQPLRRHADDVCRDRRCGDRALHARSSLPAERRCRRFSWSRGSVEAAAPYRIEWRPGNASVPRGVDQTITATLAGLRPRRRP